MRGGRAFTKPLPFMLGTNGYIIDYGADTTDLVCAQSIGMKVWREELCWNFTKSGATPGFELTPGSFNSTTASVAAAAVATIKSYGLIPLIVVTVNNNPGLSSSWSSGIPCTPAQFATAMAWIVAQPGMQGLHWELFNEPDGSGWGVPASLLVAAYQAAYPAMKEADPTCIIHSSPTENTSNNGGQGITYFNSCVTAGWLTGGPGPGGAWFDICNFHSYPEDNSYNQTQSPDAISAYGTTMLQGASQWRANMIAKGLSAMTCWWTEVGWPNTNALPGSTPQQMAYQTLFERLSMNDPLNGGNYSDWLKCVCQYATGNAGVNWGINGYPAQAILTELVAGH